MNRRYPLDDLLAACHEYADRTGRRVSFEWAVIEGVNDTTEQARALAARLLGLGAHVNLIPLNPVLGYPGRPSGRRRLERFTDELDRQRLQYSIRTRRGIDIEAGCGQLASRHRGDPRRGAARA